MVTFFQFNLALTSSAKIGWGVDPPGKASNADPRASSALSMMNPISPATAAAISSGES